METIACNSNEVDCKLCATTHISQLCELSSCSNSCNTDSCTITKMASNKRDMNKRLFIIAKLNAVKSVSLKKIIKQ